VMGLLWLDWDSLQEWLITVVLASPLARGGYRKLPPVWAKFRYVTYPLSVPNDIHVTHPLSQKCNQSVVASHLVLFIDKPPCLESEVDLLACRCMDGYWRY
jgi:hypothetical protein